MANLNETKAGKEFHKSVFKADPETISRIKTSKPKKARKNNFHRILTLIKTKSEIDEKNITDTSAESIKNIRSISEKTKPVTKAGNLGYKHVFKPIVILSYNRSKPIQKRILDNLKKRNQRLKKKKEHKTDAVRTTKKPVKTARYTHRPAKKTGEKTATAVKRILFNPFMLKSIVIGVLVFILFTVINSYISAASTPLYIIMADDSTTLRYKAEVESLDSQFKDRIDQLKATPGYDDHVVKYMNDEGTFRTNWKEILAIVAVKNEQNLTFSIEEKQLINDLFNAMNKIQTRTEIYQVPVTYSSTTTTTNPDGTTTTSTSYYTVMEDRKRLVIEVYTYGFDDVIDGVGFDEIQKEWARQLLVSDMSAMFPGVPGLSDESLTREEIEELIKNAPTINVKREHIINTAASLVGRVGYFWGGKSPAGWNSQWGVRKLVTAEGSKTTGTYQPYGLDCSGFVDWVYKTAGIGNMLAGGGTSYQWDQSYPISEDMLLPGDLAFKSTPNTSGINHVGIYAGKDSNSKKIFIHCAGGSGVVINSYSGFKYWRRVYVKLED